MKCPLLCFIQIIQTERKEVLLIIPNDIAGAILSEASTQRWTLLPLEPIDCCEKIESIDVGWNQSSSKTGNTSPLEMAISEYTPFSDCKAIFERRDIKNDISILPFRSDDSTLGGAKNMSEALSLCVYGKSGEREYCQMGPGTGLMINMSENPPTLVGFASKTTAECSSGDPIVFSRASLFMDWIQKVKGFIVECTSTDAKSINARQMTPKRSKLRRSMLSFFSHRHSCSI